MTNSFATSFWAHIPTVTHIPLAFGTTNLGDDIQSYAASALLDCHQFVNRDCMEKWPTEAVVPMIGWFGYGKPYTKATCIFVGTHIQRESRKYFYEQRVVEWIVRSVRDQGFPAMARDLDTRDFLRSVGVEAEFGGCVTQTLGRYDGTRKGTLVVDVPDESIVGFRDTHYRPYLPLLSPAERVLEARVQVQRFARFEVVHTSRLHVLLPCTALGTKVVFHRQAAWFQPERLTGFEGLIDAET